MVLIILYFIYTFENTYKIMAQETIITPLISVKPSSSISVGNNITILCDGAMSEETVILYRNGKEFLRQRSSGSKTEFTIVDVSLKHQGNYFCMMQTNSRISSHARITVIDHVSISLSITPKGSIFLGSNVKLQCNGTKSGETVNLFKNGDLYKQKMAGGSVVEFSLNQVDTKHEGSYFCKMSSSSKISNTIYIWIEESSVTKSLGSIMSEDSQSVLRRIDVIEEKKRDYTTGNMIRISVAGVLLVLLMIVVSEHFYSRKKLKIQHNRHAASNEYELD
ncbi:immunoglobulin alpha Fc receptor isoform X2 [Hyla sarda]|uniref:immunoglobulin alpha Fc receptor isoform X2 n=1 Tax=Hyla sarda TaxID=327740 RepID=UPI0024C30E3A|nr:immunoglobulin alpha Fc receptor isoform X2 [Hyla sarda]